MGRLRSLSFPRILGRGLATSNLEPARNDEREMENRRTTNGLTNDKRETANDERETANDERETRDDERRMGNGEWETANGKRRLGNTNEK